MDEHQFATDAEALEHFGRNLFQAMHQFQTGASVFCLLGPIGVMQRLGATSEQINLVISAAKRHMPYPAHVFYPVAA